MAPKLNYEIGDACWIAVGMPELSAGKVVGTFQLPHHPSKFYIIELDDNDWAHLEVRDALLMSPAADQLLSFMFVDANPKPLDVAKN